MTATLDRYQLHFLMLAPVTSEEQNALYTDKLLELEMRDDLTAEEQKYANNLATLIEKYETEKYPDANVSPEDIIRELMEANGLRQRDLSDLIGGGHESAVSRILSGRQPLSRINIERLSQRFRVSPAVFFPRSVTARR